MKKSLVLACFCLFGGLLSAQRTTPEPDLRVEIPLDSWTDQNFVLATGDDGLILFHPADSITPDREPVWRFSKLTTEFTQIWSQEIEVPFNMTYKRHYWDGKGLHVLLMFEKVKRRNPFVILTLDAETGDLFKTEGVVPQRFKLNDFSVERNIAWIGGETEMGKIEAWGRAASATLFIPILLGVGNYYPDPVLTMVDMNQDRVKNYPIDLKRAGRVETFSPNEWGRSMKTVITHGPNKKENRVYIKEYAGDKVILEVEVNPKSDNRLITAKVVHLSRHDFLVIGTYAAPYYKQRFWRKVGDFFKGNPWETRGQGIYIARFQYNGQKFVRFYNFTTFENFFEAYGKRQEKKIKKKAKRKKKRGKELLLDFNLLLHDIIETEDEYLLVAESYIPEYQQESSSYDPLTGRIVGSGRRVFVGYRYTHAIVSSFNKEDGTMNWDNSFPIWNVLSLNLKERVQVSVDSAENATLVYNYNGMLQSRKIEEGVVLEPRMIRPIRTEFASDRVKENFSGDLEYWYDRYFLAWGYQRITNTDAGIFSSDRQRRVLYLYKVGY